MQAQLLDPRFEVRISENEIGANGHTKREVLVFGTAPDGTPSTEPVIVGLDRASAGTLANTTLALGPLGASSFFTPCRDTTAGCVGPAKITLARVADPSTIVATVDIDLVTPTRVSTALPCLDGSTVVYFDGQNGDPIRNGMLRMSNGSWITQSHPEQDAQSINLLFSPSKVTQGTSWTLSIDTYQLAAPLEVGIYEGAVRPGTSTPGAPGMWVYGNGVSCGTVAGRFEVHELVLAAGSVEKALVSFEQHCDGDTTKLLEGCFHYAKP